VGKAESFAYGRDAGVVLFGPEGSGRILVHSSELVEGESLPVFPDAFLGIDDGSPGRYGYEEGDEDSERKKDDSQDEREHNVDNSLCGIVKGAVGGNILDEPAGFQFIQGCAFKNFFVDIEEVQYRYFMRKKAEYGLADHRILGERGMYHDKADASFLYRLGEIFEFFRVLVLNPGVYVISRLRIVPDKGHRLFHERGISEKEDAQGARGEDPDGQDPFSEAQDSEDGAEYEKIGLRGKLEEIREEIEGQDGEESREDDAPEDRTAELERGPEGHEPVEVREVINEYPEGEDKEKRRYMHEKLVFKLGIRVPDEDR